MERTKFQSLYPPPYVCYNFMDARRQNHCQGTSCGGLYPNLIRKAIEAAPSGANGILAIGDFAAGTVSSEGYCHDVVHAGIHKHAGIHMHAAKPAPPCA
jgi:hypothetical protein